MLPIKNRLKNKKDFERIFKTGKGCKEGLLYLKFVGNNLKDSRFGFIISTKVSKKAVVRNRIKRLLREAIKEKLKEIKKGIDVAIIVNPGFDFKNTDVEKLLKKSKII